MKYCDDCKDWDRVENGKLYLSNPPCFDVQCERCGKRATMTHPEYLIAKKPMIKEESGYLKDLDDLVNSPSQQHESQYNSGFKAAIRIAKALYKLMEEGK